MFFKTPVFYDASFFLAIIAVFWRVSVAVKGTRVLVMGDVNYAAYLQLVGR